jgi:PEP-CTERM motif
MTKRLFVLCLLLVSAVTAPAAPSQSIRQNIASFLGSHFGTTDLCPLPSPIQAFDSNPADVPFGYLPVCLTGWNSNHFVAACDLKSGHIEFCLSELQSFLQSHPIDATSLEDIKSWLNSLPIDPTAVQRLEAWLDHQNVGTDCDTGAGTSDNGTDGASSFDATPPAEVPEPGTISSLVFGIGLLGGVLVRVRSGR